jgi:hypothetical protein
VSTRLGENTRALQPREREQPEPGSSFEPSPSDERAAERRGGDEEPTTRLDEGGIAEIEPNERGESDRRGARADD